LKYRFFFFIFFLFIILGAKLPTKQIILTPDNAVKIMYNKLSKANFKGLLPYLAKKELKYYKDIIKSMKNNYKFRYKIKKQSYSINNYKELKKEIYGNLAIVQYIWVIPYYKMIFGLKRKFKKEVKMQSLLQQKDGKWFIIDTKAIKPKNEIGMKRKIKKKN